MPGASDGHRSRRGNAPTALFAAACVCAGGPAAAQPAVYDLTTRTSNIESPVLVPPGEVSLFYTHRFSGGLTSIANTPTFILGTSFLPWLEADLVYATKASVVSPATTPIVGAHDVGLTLRQELLKERDGAPIGLALHEGVFSAGLSADASASTGLSANALGGGAGLTVSRTLGPVGLVGTLRGVGLSRAVVSKQVVPGGFFGRLNAGLGATIRPSPHLSLAGDWSKYLDGPLEVPAWSASVQGEIPYTPHMFALEVTNVPSVTLGGIGQPIADLFYGLSYAIRFRGLERWILMVTPQEAAGQEASETAADQAPGAPAAVPATPSAQASTPSATPSAQAAAPSATPSAQAATPSAEGAPAVPAADLANGKRVYLSNCSFCHGALERRSPTLPGASDFFRGRFRLTGGDKDKIVAIIRDGGTGFGGGASPQMPAFGHLRSKDLEDVAAFIKTLKP